MEPIRSLRNPAVVEAGRLHRARERKKTGRTLVEGPHAVREAIEYGARVKTVFALEDDPHLAVWPAPTIVSADVMGKLAGTESPRGPVAVIDIPPGTSPDARRSTLALWGLGDPGNVGTVIRSAAAFGLSVLVGPGTADPWSPKVLRSAAGAHFRVRMNTAANVAQLGSRVAATVVRGGTDLRSLPDGPWTVVIGSEAHGIDEDTMSVIETRVTIPMPGGTESLNAGVAASIVAYELGQRDPY